MFHWHKKMFNWLEIYGKPIIPVPPTMTTDKCQSRQKNACQMERCLWLFLGLRGHFSDRFSSWKENGKLMEAYVLLQASGRYKSYNLNKQCWRPMWDIFVHNNERSHTKALTHNKLETLLDASATPLLQSRFITLWLSLVWNA